jgi:hypothetical protein
MPPGLAQALGPVLEQIAEMTILLKIKGLSQMIMPPDVLELYLDPASCL